MSKVLHSYFVLASAMEQFLVETYQFLEHLHDYYLRDFLPNLHDGLFKNAG